LVVKFWLVSEVVYAALNIQQCILIIPPFCGGTYDDICIRRNVSTIYESSVISKLTFKSANPSHVL